MKFEVGQQVIYTNDQGVCWGRKTVVKREVDDFGENRYYIEPIDAPWFPVYERNLEPVVLQEGQGQW